MKRITPRVAHNRSGVAAAEFAVCLPILLVIVFGSIEACTMIFLKQSLTVAAYEGVRVGVEGGGSNNGIEAAGNQVLTDRKVIDGSIVTVPADISTAAIGDYITVRATAPVIPIPSCEGGFSRTRQSKLKPR